MKMSAPRWDDYPNFRESEFTCKCGCKTNDMSVEAVAAAQAIRTRFKKPMNITSGYRCKKHNDSIANASKTSDHLQGNAFDFQIPGITDTLEGRLMVMGFASSLPNFKYAYCNGWYISGDKISTYNSPAMGKSIHISVKQV